MSAEHIGACIDVVCGVRWARLLKTEADAEGGQSIMNAEAL